MPTCARRRDPKICVTANGQLIKDYTSDHERSGFLALQAHGFPSHIAFGNLRIETYPVKP